jgi:hypothetical protein
MKKGDAFIRIPFFTAKSGITYFATCSRALSATSL